MTGFSGGVRRSGGRTAVIAALAALALVGAEAQIAKNGAGNLAPLANGAGLGFEIVLGIPCDTNTPEIVVAQDDMHKMSERTVGGVRTILWEGSSKAARSWTWIAGDRSLAKSEFCKEHNR